MSRVGAAVAGRWTALRAANPTWILVVGGLLFAYGSWSFFDSRHPRGQANVAISGDGRYQWAFVTSLVLDRDLDFANQYDEAGSGNFAGYGRTDTGKYANPFSIGPALMWSPFFLIGHGVSLLAGNEGAARGNDELTQQITLYASFLCAVGAALLAYVMARKRWGPGPAFAGAFVGLMCGPVLHYAINQPSFAHAPSAFAVALIWYVWDAGRGRRELRGWIGLGACVGLAMLCRAQNLVYALPVIAEGVWRLIVAGRAPGDAGQRARAVLRAAAAPALGAACALLVFLPQMIAWHSIYGYWLGVPQGHSYMRLSESLWANTLFSSRNGLFPYAPLWAVGMLGLVAVTRRDRVLGAALAATFCVTAFVNGAVVDWWAIGSIGGRRFDGLLVHAALGSAVACAALLRAVEKRPRAAAGTLIGAVLLLAAKCNGVQDRDFQNKERYAEVDHRDMVAHYNRLLNRGTRRVHDLIGNPLSWPGAIAFHWRTGAPIDSYDKVVGPNFLDGFDRSLGDFQVRRPALERAVLHFG
ncbi:MAG TPA: hypothetical protein VL172_04275, partial [Kofleriaceae bacterium]|nr:hypothetical protein [Kofleriaceae bacterium]